MTKRNPVSAPQNVWFDAEQVDASSLKLEQDCNTSIQSAIINNHIGTGILIESLQDRVIFDSETTIGMLDGEIVAAQSQPSDNNYGNQLEIILSGSKAAGKRAVKIAIIGLDFQQQLQYETFYFKVNESQITKKHYVSVLQILINDFRGESGKSFNLGGKILIKEANPYEMSRDTSMLSQMVQPNLFFRDFFSSFNSISALLKAGMPLYNVDSLNIKTSQRDNKIISANDVTTQLGQKFKATTNNIQKVTLLLSATNPDVPADDYKWTGDILVSVYALQSSLQCPTDIPPQTLIDYSPSPVPIAQIGFSYDTLLASGVQLTTVPQPVDFVFSNTPLANGSSIIPGNYYAFTIKRSGATSTGEIMVATGDKYLTDSKLTVFNGIIWVDLPDEDLWFNLSTDSAKVCDGQAYVSGIGVNLPKTKMNESSGATEDYCLNNLYFSGSDVFKGVIFADTEKNTPVQDLRTGNLVFSRQEPVPNIKLLSTLDIENLSKTTDPLLVGAITDKNIKYIDVSSNAEFSANLYTFSFVNNEIFIKIVTNPSDPIYNEDVKLLESKLLTGALNKAKIYPDFATNTNIYYRIASAEKITMIYGDVNGDGVIDESDFNLLNSYIGFDFKSTPPYLSQITTDLVLNTVTYTNGYFTYKDPFTSATNLKFHVVDAITNKIIPNGSGVDGVLVADPNDPRLSVFTSFSVDFKSLTPSVGGNKLVIYESDVEANNGGFDITLLDNNYDALTISKFLLNSKYILELFRADVNEDYKITESDAATLEKYVNKSGLIPPVQPIYNLIGTEFSVIKLSLEKYETTTLLDRNDDYFTSLITRNSDIHPLGDIYLDGYLDGYTAMQNVDCFTMPFVLHFEKQFAWEDYLVTCNTDTKQVSTIFENIQNIAPYKIDGVTINAFNSKPAFDPGRVDSYIPDNLILGGNIVKENGDYYKVDFEVGTVVLDIPPGMFGSERQINVLDDFVVGYSGRATTRVGFPAMKFADGSIVQPDPLKKDQVRISVSIQSFSPNLDGVGPNGQQGIIVDGKMGVYVDYSTGIVTLNFTNLYEDPILSTLSTRVQINVFLKKGGFNNSPLNVNSEETSNLLKAISIVSGPIVGGAAALVDLESDVFNILPAENGGFSFIITDVKTVNYTAKIGELVRVDPTGSGFNINLPSANGCAGRIIRIKNVSNSLNTVTVVPDGSELIDDLGVFTINDARASFDFVSDGVDWMVC